MRASSFSDNVHEPSSHGYFTAPRTLMKTMNQSTIYQRNMNRRRYTESLKDDPRPAPVRVLSGLPLLRAFIPQYKPSSSTATATTSTTTASTRNQKIDFLEDEKTNIFSTYVGAENTSSITCKGRDSMISVVATSSVVGCLLSELYRIESTASSISPFSGRAALLAPSNTPTLQCLPTTFCTTSMDQLHRLTSAATMSRPSVWSFKTPLIMVVPGTLRLSFLFTAKSFVESCLSNNVAVDNPQQQRQHQSSSSSFRIGSVVVSSGIAGGMLSLVRSCVGAMTPLASSIPNSAARASFGRDVLGSVVYFTTYEVLVSQQNQQQQKFNTDNPPKPDLFAIAIAGAISGTLYESIRCSMITWTNGTCATSFSALRSIISRAAPAHAILFLGYEATRDMLGASSRKAR